MGIPFFNLARQHEPLQAELAERGARVLASGQYVLGPEVAQLEKELAAYCDCRYAVGMSSGTDGLLVAMMALGIGPGDEVLCPAFTFFGTAGSVARLGAKPVWVDVMEDTYNIDLRDAEAKVSEQSKAILPVHLFGQSADMECVTGFARAHGLAVVEDAAQAIGAEYGERKVGSFGDFGVLSFYPTKNLGGFGDGGMLLCNEEALAEKAIRLRNHGMHPKYVHQEVGGNFRLDSLQAALLRVKLPYLDGYHAARRRHAVAYQQALEGVAGLVRPVVRSSARSVWNQYTVRIPGGVRDAVREKLGEAGIGTEIYYPVALPDQPCFAGVGRGGESTEVSRRLAAEVLSLPCFPELTEAERSEVIAAVKRVLEETGQG